MKSNLLLFILCLISTQLIAQHYYVGFNGGFDGEGLPSLEKLSFSNSIEAKLGLQYSDSDQWQYEISFKKIWTEDNFARYINCVPITLRYNLPFLFISTSYTSIFWEKINYTQAGQYLVRTYERRYSPGVTAAIGIERKITNSWKLNMQFNTTTSMDSWDSNKYNKVYFRDLAFLMELQYHFMKK
jgi:hypothetical protein